MLLTPDGMSFGELISQAVARREQVTKDGLTNFGRQVKGYREAAGWTQDQLGLALGLSRSSVANMEAGRQDPPLTTVILLADIFQCNIGDLV